MKWETKKLGDIAKFLSGGTPSKEKLEYWNGNIPWVSAKDLKGNRIYESQLYVTNEGLENGTRLVPENTILFVVRGMSLAKEFRISLSKISVTFNQDLKAIVLKETIDVSFLFYYLYSKGNYIKELTGEASHGTKKLPTEVLNQIEVKLPDIKTQQKIADTLSKYDDLVENNRRRIELLEESARSLYREWFVYLRFPSHEHTRIIDGIPEGWKKKKLEDIAYITMGQSPESEYYNDYGLGLYFHQGVSNFGSRFPENKTFCTKVSRIAEAGDILFSVRAPVGRINISLEKIIIGRGLAAIRSKSNYQNFLFYQLKNHFFKEDMIGSGSIFASVTKKDLQNVELITPSNSLLELFVNQIKIIDDQIKILHLQNQKLQQARALLLPRLMNGEIAV